MRARSGIELSLFSPRFRENLFPVAVLHVVECAASEVLYRLILHQHGPTPHPFIPSVHIKTIDLVAVFVELDFHAILRTIGTQFPPNNANFINVYGVGRDPLRFSPVIVTNHDAFFNFISIPASASDHTPWYSGGTL
jgi:hypothetical protein